MNETQFKLVAGAVQTSAIITLAATAGHAYGFTEAFVYDGWPIALEAAAGFVVTFVVIFAFAAVCQWLSAFTPVPPVVADDSSDFGGNAD